MSRDNTHALRRSLGRLAWLAGGFLLAGLLILDPLDLHPVDGWLRGTPRDVAAGPPAGEEVELWTCGMHPHVLEEGPGVCPIGRMDLVAVGGRPSAEAASGVEAESAAGGEAAVVIDPAVAQTMNVRRAAVERRDLRRDIRTVGYLEYDQERMVTVTTKFSGWVEKVHVNYVGEPVRRGQRLFEIYSPELVQTEQELLSAIDYARSFAGAEEARRRAEALVDAARTRLSYWDISAEQIARLEETGEIFRTLDVLAPAGGLVMKRMPGLEGMAVKPGLEAYHIADLSSLWLSVEVFEDQVAWIDVGTPAEVSFAYFPGESFRGTVRIIEPEFSEKTRTLPVKLEVPNPRGRLRAGMFATVTFQPVAARQALTVPSLAVLRTGQRNMVVVDLGDGRFAPREVTLGHQGAGLVEVLEGLSEGDMVVTSAQFLIDSEANLQEAVQKILAQRGAAPAPPPAADHSGH